VSGDRAGMAVPARLLAVLFASLLLVGACSESTQDKAKDAAESAKEDAEDATGEAAARAAAEAYRGALKSDDAGDENGLRSIDVLEENAKDLPGDPEVSGIEDGDGDGADDDGKVQFDVSDKSACVTVPASGEDVTVDDGDC